MKYLLLIKDRPETAPAQTEAEQMAEMQEWFGYDQAINEAGVVVAGEALSGAPADVTTVHVADGTVTDGPWAESKEIVGGFYLVDVPDRDTAIEWAKKMPGHVTVEVANCLVFDQ